MDVLALELSIGSPRGRLPGPPRASADGETWTASPGRGGPGAIAGSRAWLHAYTAASIAAGIGALLWSTSNFAVWSTIDPGLGGTALSGPGGGLLLWIAYGLIGSLRVLPLPGSSGVWTFHFPFIAAAMVLGGPTAGAWVGFLSTLERRELESQPWYGTLANHSVMALAAVLGGLSVEVAQRLLLTVGASPGVAGLVATAAGTIVLALVANSVAAGTIMLREGVGVAGLIDMVIRSVGRMTMAEVGLAWVFVVAFTAVGWWAPLAIAAVVLLVWPDEGVEFLDPLMGLPRLRTFERDLDRVLVRTRRGLAPGGLLLSIDLDGFGQVNKNLGKDVGDEVLTEIGRRLRELVRTTDLVGRLGGDELAVFYAGATDRAAAHRLASRLDTVVRQPILTSGGVVTVGVSIGALIVRPSPEIPARAVLMRWADMTMQEQKRTQKRAQEDGLSATGVRFHPYGTGDADPSPRGITADDGNPLSPMPGSGALTRQAVAVAGGALVLALVAVVVRLLS